MNFLRLLDPLLSVLFEDEDIIAIDKPYGLNAHTNDSKAEHGAAIQDGLIEIYEKQLGKKLHIIHRLDQTTTGVMIFGKSVESAKKYATFFLNKEVKKTYQFVTKNISDSDYVPISKPIVHKGKELDASTEFKRLSSLGKFSLWQAKPHTGRNHQIRIHARAAGIPILGDLKYEGFDFPFLCLHNREIQFPNGNVIKSNPPVYFDNLEWLNDPELAIALFEIDRRLRLFQSHSNSDQCYRLVHNKNGSEVPGYTLDDYGEVLILNWYRPKWIQIEENKFRHLAKTLAKSILVYVAADKKKILIDYRSASTSWIAKENGAKFEIRWDSGLSTGMVLNQRLQRNWVQKNANGLSVLILFGYSGGYAVSAAIAGASDIILVESSKSALEWAKKNFSINELNPESIKFLCRDSIAYIEHCVAKNTKFDLIICDTPTFLRREKSVFRAEKDFGPLLKNLFSCLTGRGQLLVSTQFDGFFLTDLRKAIVDAQKTAMTEPIEIHTILPSLDFELDNQKANLKSFLVKKL